MASEKAPSSKADKMRTELEILLKTVSDRYTQVGLPGVCRAILAGFALIDERLKEVQDE